MRRTLSAVIVILAVAIAGGGSSRETSPRRMSFHNRLLLNRAVLAGLELIEVLVLARPEPAAPGADDETRFAVEEAASLVERLGGRVKLTEAAIGYLRVEVPARRFLQLADAAAITLNRDGIYHHCRSLIHDNSGGAVRHPTSGVETTAKRLDLSTKGRNSHPATTGQERSGLRDRSP